MPRKTDEEILREYYADAGFVYPEGVWEECMLKAVAASRKEEPRINSGMHLHDYWAICDDDDTMDSFYGPDYFKAVPV